MKKMVFTILFFMFPLICFAQEMQEKASIINSFDYILYLPSGLDQNKKYPLVLALSPSADAESMLEAWKDVSEQYKWIILASRQHKNGMEFKQIGSILVNTLRIVILRYPVDSKKIIATGFSGGGMASHYLAMVYPNLVSAVIINTAMISEDYSAGKNYSYPKSKIAVFLASPTDFRYQQMKNDRNFLEDINWETKWIEFSGGHTIAPVAIYQEAAGWLNEQLK